MPQDTLYLKKLCHHCFPSGNSRYYKKGYLVGEKKKARRPKDNSAKLMNTIDPKSERF